MQQELQLIQKLLERKKAYLQRVENEKAKQAIKAEINIIERFITAATVEASNRNHDFKALNTELTKKVNQLENTKRCLELVCIMHGIIDYPLFVARGEKLLLNEIKFDMQENCRRVPTEIKKHL